MSTGPQTPFAAYSKTYFTSENREGCFPLSVSGQAAPLYVSGEDFPGVLRVARLFQADIGRVAGTKPELSQDALPSAKEMILIGTLGHSPIIDQLVQEGKLDGAELAGKWETSLLQVVEKPLAGVERALVIA